MNTAEEALDMVMITHHLADILPEIDRVIMMRDGRIFADGRKKDLLTRAKLKELFGVDVELSRRDGYWYSW